MTHTHPDAPTREELLAELERLQIQFNEDGIAGLISRGYWRKATSHEVIDATTYIQRR